MAITGDGRNFSSTPGMGLRLPTVGVCGALGIEPPGLSWLELVNSALGTLDSHTHAPGFGSQIPSAALAINADVSWGGNNITSLRSARFGAVALGSLGPSDIGCLAVSGADLYYVDTAGNQVRLTSGGGVAGTPGSISGLASPASASYTPASKLFTFTSSSGFAASLSSGPLSIGDATVSGGKSATLSVPAGLAANYALTLPSGLPAANALLSLSTAGAISAFGTVSGSDLTLAGNLTVQGASGLMVTGLLNFTGGATIKALGSDSQVNLQGNHAAGNAIGADVFCNSQIARTAGYLMTWASAGVGKASLDYQGLLSLSSQAGPIQPASYVTAITPNAPLAGGNGLGYWKDATGMVRVQGVVAGGPNISNGQALFTLPAGFRPSSTRSYVTVDNSSNNNLFVVSVSTGGVVSLVSPVSVGTSGSTQVVTVSLYLDCISFLAAA